MPIDLYEPIHLPKPVADDVWGIDGPVARMAPVTQARSRAARGLPVCLHEPPNTAPGPTA